MVLSELKKKTISAIALCDFTSPSLDNDIRDFFCDTQGGFPLGNFLYQKASRWINL